MRIDVKTSGDPIEDDLAEMAERVDDSFADADAQAKAELVRQNAPVNFDESHKDSILRRTQNGWEIGSNHPHYAKLVDVDEDQFGDVLVDFATEGLL